MSKDKNELKETEKLARIVHSARQLYEIKSKLERTFDGKVWKSGNALVITLPYTTVEKFKIKEGDLLEITIRK